jgi:chemotaxis response regulator CheB
MARVLNDEPTIEERRQIRTEREQKEFELRNNAYVMSINSPTASGKDKTWDTLEVGTPLKVEYMNSGVTVALNFISHMSGRISEHKSAYENDLARRDFYLVTAGIFNSEKAIEGLIEKLRSGRYRLNIFLKSAPTKSADGEITILSAKNIQRVELQDLLDNVIVFKNVISE